MKLSHTKNGVYGAMFCAAMIAAFVTADPRAIVAAGLAEAVRLALAGARRVPALWSAPLNDTLKSGIANYHPISIAECARRSLEIIRKTHPR